MDEGGLGKLFDRIFGPRDPGVRDNSPKAPYKVNTDPPGLYRERLLDDIKAAAREVFAALPGCSEAVYESALEVELNLRGYSCRRQVTSPINYRGAVVGYSVLDMIVDGVIVEIKAISKLSSKDEQQLRNYLTATGLETGLLINFPPGSEEIEVIDVVQKHT